VFVFLLFKIVKMQFRGDMSTAKGIHMSKAVFEINGLSCSGLNRNPVCFCFLVINA